MTFEEMWAKKEAEGYQYGRDALEQVRFGWELRGADINTPEIEDFMRAVPLEALHQRERWGSEHDEGKTAADWFWLVGYLAGKALHAVIGGNADKAKHHLIATAAALLNWHAALLGKTNTRPGIETPK